ncbi:hypothetical protein Leryth_027545 [Lithospermum erythrorhizon]|uniref:PHD-type zinc finger plants domain-containing protein n=1 Tax=Lithospermum erythrorhizon TaxID=34254 RepID=A0AAV3PFD8_LITER|nr:hypothetical protein Leryth_027545 [Lithospermum erythrorhizon]
MVDNVETVCCMCGDVGFPDKLFNCIKCRNRFQHSYCSNYYSSEASEPIQVCDWCQSEVIRSSGRQSVSSRKSMAMASSNDHNKRSSEFSSEKSSNKHHGREEGSTVERGKNPSGGTPSPRQATRRYKLLKDVMC